MQREGANTGAARAVNGMSAAAGLCPCHSLDTRTAHSKGTLPQASRSRTHPERGRGLLSGCLTPDLTPLRSADEASCLISPVSRTLPGVTEMPGSLTVTPTPDGCPASWCAANTAAGAAGHVRQPIRTMVIRPCNVHLLHGVGFGDTFRRPRAAGRRGAALSGCSRCYSVLPCRRSRTSV